MTTERQRDTGVTPAAIVPYADASGDFIPVHTTLQS